MSTFWVHSSSRARFEQSFGEIANRIRADAGEVGRSDTLRIVSKWLSDAENGPWLLILDNADDARVLLQPQQDHTARDPVGVKRCLIDFIPEVPHGIVLVTTRDRTSGWALTGDNSNPIEVESMGPVESLELLKGKLPIESENEAMELLKELDYVPLAISQAGAYIRERGPLMTIPKYCAEFRSSQENQTALLNSNHADLRRDGALPNAVITSWLLSFAHIRTAYPEAANLLSLMSIFNRQAIPQFLVQGVYDDLTFCEVMGPLLSFSLVRAETTGQMFELHRLVQITTRHWLERDGSRQHWVDCAIGRMAEWFPSSTCQRQKWVTCEKLLPHVAEVLGNEAGSEQHRLKYAKLLTDSSYFLIDSSRDFLLAEERSKKALIIQQDVLPAGDDTLLDTLNVICYACARQWRYQEAEELQMVIMERRMEKGVDMDRHTAGAMHNLAHIYICLGKYEEAEELLLRVRGLWTQFYSHESPFLSSIESNMAHLKHEQGDFQMAETLCLSALKRMTQLSGCPDQLLEFRTGVILSKAYESQKRHVEAEKLFLENLSISRRLFGESHIETLNVAHDLSLAYYRLGKLVEAERQCRECLDLMREIVGPRDLATLRTEALLGTILFEQGSFLAASELLVNVVNVSREVHGAEHEETMFALHECAVCVERLSNKQEAIRLMTEVFEVRTKLLGADHPKTVNSAGWLAHWTAAEDGEDASREADMGQNENRR